MCKYFHLSYTKLLRAGEGTGVTAYGYGTLLWGDENFLELDRGGDYTTL